MTAEIAILNKLAVVLAADSAVTIGSGIKDDKIFDSADKLFELCRADPIGIMLYNVLDFAEVPIQTLINIFRNNCRSFDSVEDAAKEFLLFLNQKGKEAPDRVKNLQISQLLQPLLLRIEQRRASLTDNFIKNLPQQITADDIRAELERIVNLVISAFENVFGALDDAKFVGDGPLDFDQLTENQIRADINTGAVAFNDQQKEKLVKLAKVYLTKNMMSGSFTGIVIAGFGKNELFPTMVSFETDGMICNRLKYVKTNAIDIDREGKNPQ